MAAEAATTTQHNAIGISTAGNATGSGVTVTTACGGADGGKSTSGCVFFICTADLTGGSGKTLIRAVSFFGAAGAGSGSDAVAAAGFNGDRVGK